MLYNAVLWSDINTRSGENRVKQVWKYDSLLSITLLKKFIPYCICFTVILEKPIRIPRSLSVKAASVLKGFLNKVKIILQVFS